MIPLPLWVKVRREVYATLGNLLPDDFVPDAAGVRRCPEGLIVVLTHGRLMVQSLLTLEALQSKQGELVKFTVKRMLLNMAHEAARKESQQ